MMGDREGARRQLTALFVGHFIGQDLAGCPQDWRTEVLQLGTVSNWLTGRRSVHHLPSYGGGSVELRPHRQRQTVGLNVTPSTSRWPAVKVPRTGCSQSSGSPIVEWSLPGLPRTRAARRGQPQVRSALPWGRGSDFRSSTSSSLSFQDTRGCPKPVRPAHATMRYSWMSPPRRSVRRSRMGTTSAKAAGSSCDEDGQR